MTYTRLSALLFCWLLTHQGVAQLKDVSLEDIWLKPAFRAASVDAYHPMPDGETYVQFVSVPDQKMQDLVVYNYATGKQVSVLVKGTDLEEQLKAANGALSLDDLVWNTTNTKFLVATDAEPIYRHSYTANFYVYDLSSKKATALSANGKQQEATFSPDGTKVAFVRDNNLFVKDLATNAETQITKDGERNKIINGIPDWVYEEEFSFSRAFEWSPDSKKLAWIRFDETAVKEYTVQFFTGLYPENYTYKYPKVGETNSTVSVWIQDISTAQPVRVDIADKTVEYIPRIKWTNNSNQLCVTTLNRFQNNLNLLLADATTGKTKTLLTETDERYVDVTDNLRFLSNNGFIWSSSKDGYNQLYRYDANGKLVNQITTANGDVTEFYGIDKDGKKLYYQAAETSPLQRQVYSINVDGKNKTLLTPRAGTNNASFNESFTNFMLAFSNANTPPEYFICKNDGKVLRTLQTNDDLKKKRAEYNIATKEFFTFTTPEGISLNGWTMKPANFDATKKYPVFMWVYGGPGSQQVLDQYGGTSDVNFNYLCQKGYVIACVDNRGTGARGEDFLKQTYLQMGKLETQDQISAARYLATLPYVDKNRIGIAGWSYGGFMSMHCIAQGADVFKTAVAVAPVSDWRFYDSVYSERFMRTQKENEKGYTENAPLAYVDKIKDPFLLVHGLADDNVHYQNTAVLLKALYDKNIKFTQMTFPDKNHGIYGGNTRFYLYSQVWDYVQANL